MTQAVPAGYKQTEVGVIPEDWEVFELGEIANFLKGSGLPKKELVYNGKNLCIHYGQLFTTYGPVIEKPISSTDTDTNIKSVTNDILMPTSDVTPNGLATASCIKISGVILGGDILIIRADRKLLNGVFFAYLVKIKREQIMQLVTGSTVYHLYGSDMAKLSFAKPPIKEQTAIAQALSDVDALIDAQQQLINKKQAIKTATMQQLLTGRTRLPQFALREDGSLKGTKPSELGEIPEDWEVVTLEQSVNCLDNLRIPLNEQQRSKMRGDIPYCGANGIVGWVNEYVLDDDVILMAEDGGYFDEFSTRPIAYRMIGKCWVNNHAHILQAKESFDQGYIFYCLVHKDIQKYLASGTRAKLNKSEMERIEIIVPSAKQEQTAIATILSDMDAEIQALEQRLGKTRQIKQGMMQELLTGRVRLISGELKVESGK